MAQLAAGSAVPCALVALTVFGDPAWACLLCFTSYSERIRICQTFVGVAGPKVEKCEEALEAAFKGLLDTEINYDERSHLHDSFTQMTLSLQEIATAQGSYEVAFPYAAEKMREAIAQLKEGKMDSNSFSQVHTQFFLKNPALKRPFAFQACIPPCGRGPSAVQDVTVRRGDQAMFSCTVNFQLPREEITYSWKFAEGGVSRGGARAKVFWRRVRLH
ncbi:PREDICTED: sperm acrosome membrane-associated protein 6-like [Myotis davidii]|uniref:sperm acrosome membrane-associated protein 6-like n=1 Tax=Myotis davidii TaxID=225400 RepID=UPI000767282A|nr:PREDICTED: sperm acrosome membrane-associated protein 6-like [Myotis davidii]